MGPLKINTRPSDVLWILFGPTKKWGDLGPLLKSILDHSDLVWIFGGKKKGRGVPPKINASAFRSGMEFSVATKKWGHV